MSSQLSTSTLISSFALQGIASLYTGTRWFLRIFLLLPHSLYSSLTSAFSLLVCRNLVLVLFLQFQFLAPCTSLKMIHLSFKLMLLPALVHIQTSFINLPIPWKTFNGLYNSNHEQKDLTYYERLCRKRCSWNYSLHRDYLCIC